MLSVFTWVSKSCQVKLKIWNLVYAAPLHCLFTDKYLNLIVVLMSGVRSCVSRLYGWYCCFFNCLVYRTRESFVGSMFLLKCVPVYCYLMCAMCYMHLFYYTECSFLLVSLFFMILMPWISIVVVFKCVKL
jgi:hypothetical protein